MQQINNTIFSLCVGRVFDGVVDESVFQGEQGSPGLAGQKGPAGPLVRQHHLLCFMLFLLLPYPSILHLSSSISLHVVTSSSPFSSHPPPAGTSWFARSAWRPRCKGREGTPGSYRPHRTPRRAGREGRPRSVRASGILRNQRRDCESCSLCPMSDSSTVSYIHLEIPVYFHVMSHMLF